MEIGPLRPDWTPGSIVRCLRLVAALIEIRQTRSAGLYLGPIIPHKKREGHSVGQVPELGPVIAGDRPLDRRINFKSRLFSFRDGSPPVAVGSDGDEQGANGVCLEVDVAHVFSGKGLTKNSTQLSL